MEEGWFDPAERLPEAGQRVDFVFRLRGRKGLWRCHATWGAREGGPAFQILGGCVPPHDVTRWRPAEADVAPARRGGWALNLSPEERERRRRRMKDYNAAKRNAAVPPADTGGRPPR